MTSSRVRLTLVVCGLLSLLLLLSLSSAKVTVHLVAHTHDDVGWLKTVDQYYVGSNKTIQDAAVQYLLTTVVDALLADPQRKFMYVEQAFFQRFWRQQTDARQADIRRLVHSGQLEFVNGGWCMHDEATAHWMDMVDQTTLGHRHIVDAFGVEANPTIGWQIDPFGHSALQASLLSAAVGFNGWFTARIHWQDFDQRFASNRTEWIWRTSPSLPSQQLFAGVFGWAKISTYNPSAALTHTASPQRSALQLASGAPASFPFSLHPLSFSPLCLTFYFFSPPGFSWELNSNDPAIQDDPRLSDYNLNDRVRAFIDSALYQAAHTKGSDVLWTMGSDFQWRAANEWYTNGDKLIAAVNAEGTVQAKWSTPSIYVKAKWDETQRANLTWPLKTDDLFPYSMSDHQFWTGFFTSRPALKRYVRVASAHLQVMRQLELLLNVQGNVTERLWEALSVAQHHDGVSGTSKQHVAFDYAQRMAGGINEAEEALYAPLAASLTLKGGTPPALVSCPLSNVSLCPVTQSSADAFTLLLYNPLAHSRTERVTVPVTSPNMQVVGPVGTLIPSTIIPTLYTAALEDSTFAPYQLHFQAQVEAMGYATYFLQSAKPAEAIPAAVPTSYVCGQGTGFNSTNGLVTLSFGPDCVLRSYSIRGGSTTALAHTVGYYLGWQTSSNSSVRDCVGYNSGAYFFRPQKPDPVLLPPLNASFTDTTAGVVEVRVSYGAWYVEVFRLTEGSAVVEVEFTVGPIPIDDDRGKEVITRYTAKAWGQESDQLVMYTESNGRDFARRQNNYRPSFAWNNTEPVGGNYLPMTAVTYLNSSLGIFSLATDRSQGVATFQPGSLEAMTFRRLLCDDYQGVGEELNETTCITHSNPGQRCGKPLVIQGRHYLQFTPDLHPVRQLQNRVYSPLHLLLAPLTTIVAEYVSTHTVSLSLVNASALSPLLEVSHLHRWDTGYCPWPRDGTTGVTALLRIAHLHGVEEGAKLAQNATVDLALLFTRWTVVDAAEVSLTANQPAAKIQPWRWPVEGEEREVGGMEEETPARGRRRESEEREAGRGGLMLYTVQPGEVKTWLVKFS